MHSSFLKYRKQQDMSDSDSDEELAGDSDDSLNKDASLIEASFEKADLRRSLNITSNYTKAMGLSLISRPTQKMLSVAESSGDDDETGLDNKNDSNDKFSAGLDVSEDESESKFKECMSEPGDESFDESLIVPTCQKKKNRIISSESDDDDVRSPVILKQLSHRIKPNLKPVVTDSDISEDECVKSLKKTARKSEKHSPVKCDRPDSNEDLKNLEVQQITNSRREKSVSIDSTTSDESFSPDDNQPVPLDIISTEHPGTSSKAKPQSLVSLEEDARISLVSSDSDDSNSKINMNPKSVCQPFRPTNYKPTEKGTELNNPLPLSLGHKYDSADKVIDLTILDSPKKPFVAARGVNPSTVKPTDVHHHGKSPWLNTLNKIPSKDKTEGALPLTLKPAGVTNDYAHMISMAELQMLKGNITAKKKDLQKNNDVLAQINLNALPDKGKKLQMRSIDLKKEVDEMEHQLTRLQSKLSDPSNMHTLQPGELAQKKLQPPSWQDLRKTNDVQHGFGVKAMENYYAEKAATLEVLQQLHNSLKTRPDVSILANDPQELRSDVKLMPHQKHALAWMMWRENENPSGGILADDMGLGKTLTMISLVLKCSEDNIVYQCSDSEPDDDSKENKSSYKSKHRSTNGGTLVVCPASLLNQWEGEVKRRVKSGVLNVEVHHGPNRENRPHRLARFDMVVTTYAIVMNEFTRKGPLHRVKWQRIILDEAHTVRNHKSQTSIAVVELKGHCRWALTGTPIHNKELDVFALLKFLRCSPFNDLPMWKKWVDNKRAGGMTRLNTIMTCIMLRRTKAELQEEKSFDCLPVKNVENIEVKLDADEFAVYEKLLIFSRALMAEFLHQKAEKDALLNGRAYTPLNFRNTNPEENPFGANTKLGSMHQKMTSITDVKTFHILVLLLRLRQICCHPGLIKKMLDNESVEQDGIEDKDGLDIDLVAQINKMSLSENHATDFKPEDGLNDEDILKSSNPVFNTDRASCKMKAVFACLEKNIKGTQDKAVVVSQWPSMLGLMWSHLKDMHIKCSLLTGAIPVKDRQKIVDDFNKVNEGSQVLLLSLTAGGVGLNLVGGNHLLLCDLHWNPQLEAQACDRIYRMGQKKPVHIYKFICEDTIEQRIKNIQLKKLEIATGILTGAHKSQANKLTLDDLKTIFNM